MIELLVVVAIISLLAVFGSQVAGSSSSRNFGVSVYELADVLRYARSTAVAQNTYVRVGFTQDSQNNTDSLLVGLIVGTSGQSGDFAKNRFRPLMKPTRFERVTLTDSLNIALPDLPSGTSVTSSSVGSFIMQVGGANKTFGSTIQFSPNGEVSIASSGTPWIDLIMKPAVDSANNQAVVQISGISGQVKVFRPEVKL